MTAVSLNWIESCLFLAGIVGFALYAWFLGKDQPEGRPRLLSLAVTQGLALAGALLVPNPTVRVLLALVVFSTAFYVTFTTLPSPRDDGNAVPEAGEFPSAVLNDGTYSKPKRTGGKR